MDLQRNKLLSYYFDARRCLRRLSRNIVIICIACIRQADYWNPLRLSQIFIDFILFLNLVCPTLSPSIHSYSFGIYHLQLAWFDVCHFLKIMTKDRQKNEKRQHQFFIENHNKIDGKISRQRCLDPDPDCPERLDPDPVKITGKTIFTHISS